MKGKYAKMKRTICILLVLLLLCGCTPTAETPGSSALPASETAAPATAETVPAATEAALVGVEALNADSVLLYRQEDFEARQGTLLPLQTALSAPEDELIPRPHIYDELFPGDAALWLRLLDYALGNGYQGFSVPAGSLPEIDLTQRRVLKFIYWIDGGKILSLDRDGCTTVWYACEKPDTMEKFSLGLAAARDLAAQAPRGDEWETASWIFSWLAENVAYGDRTPYYFRRGHMLYDALVEKDCLCSGYATAMYYLCSLCGIECLNVYGLATDPETPGGLGDHLWNYARIYGNWYVFDPTANAAMRMGVNVAFALSFDTMQMIGGNKPTGEYTDAALIPACETNFDPVTGLERDPGRGPAQLSLVRRLRRPGSHDSAAAGRTVDPGDEKHARRGRRERLDGYPLRGLHRLGRPLYARGGAGGVPHPLLRGGGRRPVPAKVGDRHPELLALPGASHRHRQRRRQLERGPGCCLRRLHRLPKP